MLWLPLFISVACKLNMDLLKKKYCQLDYDISRFFAL